MAHARKQIRDYVVAGLSSLPTTGDRVYVGRTRPLPADNGPSLLIYMRTETSARGVRGAPPVQERPASLHIEGRVNTAEPPDDLLDQIAVEIEAGMAAMIDYGSAVFFGGMVQNVDLKSTEIIAKAEGDRHIGGVQLTYEVTYRTVEGAAATLV